MAEKTTASVQAENGGSLNLKIVKFSDIDDADTWVSGMTGINAVWCNPTDDPTSASTVAVACSFSGGTVTFNSAEESRAVTLFVLATD